MKSDIGKYLEDRLITPSDADYLNAVFQAADGKVGALAQQSGLMSADSSANFRRPSFHRYVYLERLWKIASEWGVASSDSLSPSTMRIFELERYKRWRDRYAVSYRPVSPRIRQPDLISKIVAPQDYVYALLSTVVEQFLSEEWLRLNSFSNFSAAGQENWVFELLREPEIIADCLSAEQSTFDAFTILRSQEAYPELVSDIFTLAEYIGGGGWSYPFLPTHASELDGQTAEVFARRFMHDRGSLDAIAFGPLSGNMARFLYRAFESLESAETQLERGKRPRFSLPYVRFFMTAARRLDELNGHRFSTTSGSADPIIEERGFDDEGQAFTETET